MPPNLEVFLRERKHKFLTEKRAALKFEKAGSNQEGLEEQAQGLAAKGIMVLLGPLRPPYPKRIYVLTEVWDRIVKDETRFSHFLARLRRIGTIERTQPVTAE